MFYKLKLILKSFSGKERLSFFAALFVFAVSLIALVVFFVNKNTELVAVAGGQYVEGVVGQPTFINPVLSAASEVDGDLIALVFADVSSLLDTEEIENDGKVWRVRIKGDVVWQDGAPLTVDDIIFTIKAIQSPELNSPLLAAWKGAKAERVSSREVKITLPSRYVYFENTLRNLRPIPKHIFENTAFSNLKLAVFNLEPIASGPFKFASLKKEDSGFISRYGLLANEKYFGRKPNLERFEFRFYPNEDDLIEAFNNGEVDGFGGVSPQKISLARAPHNLYRSAMPRYFAIFLNAAANPLLKDKKFRQALALAVDKNAVISNAFAGFAGPAFGPLVKGMEGYEESAAADFDRQKSLDSFAELGWDKDNGLLKSKDSDLKLILTVPEIDYLKKAAEEIKKSWAEIGLPLEIKAVGLENFYEEALAGRNYELLLFGNIYGSNPDLFSFWHSSEKFHPGLNLSLFDDKDVDNLIEETRTILSAEGRFNNLTRLQATIASQQPAIFLASPEFVYVSKKSLGGYNENFLPLPSFRFRNISEWYVKTARVFK